MLSYEEIVGLELITVSSIGRTIQVVIKDEFSPGIGLLQEIEDYGKSFIGAIMQNSLIVQIQRFINGKLYYNQDRWSLKEKQE